MHKAIIAILALLLLVSVGLPLNIVFRSAQILGSGLDADPGSVEGFYRTGTYGMDPNLALTAIEEHSSIPFLAEEAILPPINSGTRTNWTQKEYSQAAQEFFTFVWKETLNRDWSIHKMSFFTDCRERPAGFSQSTFIYYQLIFQQGKLQYKGRAITISPAEGKVSWGGDSVFPRPILGRTMVDLDTLKITADQALEIAEQNGGAMKRQSLQNECNLRLYFDGNWKVVYADKATGLSMLEIDVDPYTGKIIKTR